MISLIRFFKAYTEMLLAAFKILLSLLLCVVILGGIISCVEKLDLWNALYFAFITALTIGYGDFTPHTIIGKTISILLGIIGMIFVGIMVAAAIKSLEKAST